MAIEFATRLSDYITRASPAVTDYPLSMAGWFLIDDVTQEHLLMSVFDSASPNERMELKARGDQVGDPLGMFVKATTQLTDNSSGAYSSGVWFHAGCVFSDATTRRIYLDGVETVGSTTDSGAFSVLNTTGLGTSAFPAAQGMDGKAADCGWWAAALSAAEMASLADGYSCFFIRPQSLVMHLELVSSAVIERRGPAWTVTGTASAFPHPPIIYPRRTRSIFVPVAGGAAGAHGLLLGGMRNRAVIH